MTQVLIFALAMGLALPASAQESVAAAEGTGAAVVAADTIETAPVEAEVAEIIDDPPGLVVMDAADVSLDDFLWIKRPIVVFADTPADPRFDEQLDLLLARPEELLARDVVILTDADPAARSAIRLKLRPRGFQLTILAKDGTVNLRKPFPWDVREISRAIDKMPLRQEEIRAAKAASSQ